MWIGAPAGAGKTTLVAGWIYSRNAPFLWYRIDAEDNDPACFFSYLALAARKASPRKRKPLPVLAPEYLEGVCAFSRRFFEAMALRLPPSSVVVFDNYQEVPAGSPLHEIQRSGIEAVRSGTAFALISRTECHPEFSGICLANSARTLGWPDIRFSLEESRGLAVTHGRRDLDDQTLSRLHRKADGWAAGLALLLRTREPSGDAGLSGQPPSVLFDYFAQEIFSGTAGVVRDFLAKTSLLPSMTASMAARLTGNDDARAILERLRREHYFIESYAGEETFYRYHPLFREFLLKTAAGRFPKEEISAAKVLAADLLAENGHFEDAAEIMLETGDQERLIALILKRALAMISKGRLGRLSEWMSAVAPERLSRDPWLCYWRAVCLHPFELSASEGSFVLAFRLFLEQKKPCESLMAWGGIVACIITEWRDFSKLDPWIDWLVLEGDAALDALPVEQRARIVGLMLICLTFRQPLNPKMDFYERKAEAVLDEPLDMASLLTLGSHLATHYTKMGLLSRARAAIDLVDSMVGGDEDFVSPERILWQTVKASYYALSGEKEQCLRQNRKGLDLAESSGMRIYDIFMLFFGTMAGFIDEDREVVDCHMEQIRTAKEGSGRILPIIRRQILGWRCLVEKDYAAALEHVRAAMHQTSLLGSDIEHAVNRICCSRILFELGRREEARAFLREGRAFYPRNSVYIVYMRLTTEACFAYREDDPAAGDEYLREAFAVGARHSIVMHHFWTAGIARPLCLRAMELGIETSYVRKFARRHGIDLEPTGRFMETLRRPVVVYTLGRFLVLIDGSPLVPRGKAPKKPLELLKAIIAFGGANVPAEKICDALWPEADGDRAHNNFKFALHRLRRLLGNDKAVVLRGGKVGLNPDCCWSDAQAFLDSTKEVLRCAPDFRRRH